MKRVTQAVLPGMVARMHAPLPAIDPSAHLSLEQLEQRFPQLPPAPKERGTLDFLVSRGADETRWTPDRATLTVEGGMPADKWMLGAARPDTQLAVQQTGVARLVANGQSLAFFGDNLTLDLDLGAENLPAGTELSVGEARLVVTPEPHDGCRKYADRFGRDALRFISAPQRRSLRLRGVYLRVVEPGEVWVGAPVVVLG